MNVRFFSTGQEVVAPSSPAYEQYLIAAKERAKEAKGKYFPVINTVKKEHSKLTPHLKRMNVLYNNMDANTRRKLGASGAVITGTATAVGLGLRLNHSTLDEFIDEDYDSDDV